MKPTPNPSSEPGPDTRPRLSGWGTLLLTLPFIVQALFQLYQLGCRVIARNDTTYPEGANILSFLTSLRTGMLYSNPFLPPYNGQEYGPLFYIVGTCAAWLANGRALLTAEIMRAVALGCFVASAIFIGLIAWHLERSRSLAISTAVFCLACAWPIPFCASTRSDSVAIFLIVLALTVYVAAPFVKSHRLFCAGVLAGTACLTKQTMAPVLLALLIDAVLGKKFRNAVLLLAGAATGPILVLGFLSVRHEPFLQNLSLAKYSVTSISTIGPQLAMALQMNEICIVPFLLSLLGVIACWRNPVYRPILLAAGLAVVSNIYALSNTGAYVNYLILPSLLVLIFVPAGLRLLQQWSGHSLLVPIATSIVLMLLLYHQRHFLIAKAPENIDPSGLATHRVLSDVTYLEMQTLNPELLDPFFYHQLDVKGAWSSQPVVDNIDRQVYDLILLTGHETKPLSFEAMNFNGMSAWGEASLEAMRRHYKPLCTVQDHLALVPQDRPGSLSDGELEAIFHEPCLPTTDLPLKAVKAR